MQQLIRDRLRELGAPFGLVDGDIESTGMGQSGVDVLLSPAAKRIFPLAIEAKNVEALSIPKVFFDHYDKYAASPFLKLLIHNKNHQREPLVTLRLSDLLALFMKGIGTPHVKK